MSILPRDQSGCPYLILAPMEGIGDACFRQAIASIGGFDEAVRDFIRVPSNAHVKSLAKCYKSNELDSIPLSAQIMGSDPELMGEMALELSRLGAPRIDINCGCPSNTVTGRGAGSSLLKSPDFLYEVARAVVQATSIPVTIKMRSGFEDTSLFKENVLAAEASGVRYITLHPRTKTDGYGPPAKWEFIALAKSLLKIPVVGNGDILSVRNALDMLQSTHCDALMIGRGSVMNPFVFHQIRAHFSKTPYQPQFEELITYLHKYVNSIPQETRPKVRTSKLKQLLGLFFKSSPELLAERQNLLTSSLPTPEALLDYSIPILLKSWSTP